MFEAFGEWGDDGPGKSISHNESFRISQAHCVNVAYKITTQ